MIHKTYATALFAFAMLAASTDAQQYALSFDGVNDRAATSSVPGKLTHTHEAIARLRQLPTNGSDFIASNEVQNGNCDNGSKIYYADSRILYDVDIPGCGNYNAAITPLNDTGWHHIAGTFDGQNQRLYVDGVLVATKANLSPTVGFGYEIGDTVASFAPLLGDIAEVRFWDHARTQEQLLATIEAGSITGPQPGLVALYLLEEGAGQTAFDSSGNGYHLTLGSSSSVDSRDPTWIEYCGAIPYGVDADANQTLDQAWNPGSSVADGTFDITGASPDSNGLLLVGLDPFDAMAQNTTILVNPSTAIYLSVTYDAAGALSLPVDLTATPSTVGLTVRTQAFELTGSTFTGLRASNALAATLCP